MRLNSLCNGSVCVYDHVSVCLTKTEYYFYVCMSDFSTLVGRILITFHVSSAESQCCDLCRHIQIYTFFQKWADGHDSRVGLRWY